MVRPSARALPAPDAQQRVDDNAAKRRMVLVLHPEHALGHRAIVHASGRSRTSCAHFVDDGDDVRLALAALRVAFGDRVGLLDLAVHELRDFEGDFRQRVLRRSNSFYTHSFSARRGSQSPADTNLAPKTALWRQASLPCAQCVSVQLEFPDSGSLGP